MLPIALGGKLWQEVWQGTRPSAWDGTGHYSVAQIYSQSIFPDTFGWTHAYFAGMPFPNFYPPVFYWCVALLHHTGLLSFAASFKLVAFLPVLLMPACLWLLGWATSDKGRLAAMGAALACVPLLADSRFLLGSPSGLDYFSTFQIGLYTQPLGFVLLTCWLISYLNLNAGRKHWKVALSCVLLALTILANFFNAVTAFVFVASTLIRDLISYRRAASEDKREALRALVSHSFIPLVALCLSSFWLVAVFSQYEYFVTRPYVIGIGKLLTPVLCGWYALALIGGVLWLRRPTRATLPYLSACAALAFGVLLSETLAPRWFPLQSSRFLATLTFLLTVPAGHALAAAFRALAALLGEKPSGGAETTFLKARYSTGVAFALLLLYAITSPGPRSAFAFYPKEGKEDVDGVLAFARDHRDGRYLVEMINPQRAGISFDARAINSYLGAQGNETLSAVFHEASPNALFTLPLINAFSDYPDSFGVSSLLADDLDFVGQPLSRHVERARFMGVKYLVIRSPAMKERVTKETAVAARQDFGNWSIFELRGEMAPRAISLPYRPALVVSGFTLKQRRQNEWGFVRMAEEQFADGWFDVQLARSPEQKIDALNDLEQFGALVIEKYEYGDEGKAYELLRQFARTRLLILLSDKSELFRRIQSSRADFPHLEIIERGETDPGESLEAIQPAHHYQDSPIRQAWAAIRRALDTNKVPVDSAVASVPSEVAQNSISFNVGPQATGTSVPVLIATTFHPNWRRSDGDTLYAATPFYMLTFARGPVTLAYERKQHERVGLWASVGTLILLCGYCFVIRLKHRGNVKSI